MIVVMAIVDALGVASIMPFMAVLSNPALIESNAVLGYVYRELNVETHHDFLVVLGFCVFALLLFSLVLKSCVTFLQLRFVLMSEYSIGKRLVEGYLRQPYAWFLSQHSSGLGKTILSEVGEVVNRSMLPLMTIISQSMVALFLLGLLVFIDPFVALVVGLVLVTVYGVLLKLIVRYLSRIGKERLDANELRFKIINEVFSAVKEVKLAGRELFYLNGFSKPAQKYAASQAAAQVVGQLPRFALEAIAFGGMILVILYLMSQSESFSSVLPIISLYAFAGYRLMPALQQIYNSISQLNFSGPALDKLYSDLRSIPHAAVNENANVKSMHLNYSIRLENVEFTYHGSTVNAINGLSLTIPAKNTIALVGESGSGKSTVIDLILGLLEVTSGSIQVDGVELNEDNRRSWQNCIGYVPQSIYLVDSSIVANIAFGVEPEKVDMTAVLRAGKIANLHDFVSELPEGYYTAIGERGVRLSGGQRQRIGIARALYHKPDILVLDEATSALDGLTEKSVMEAVNNLSHDLTIIIIAHRLTTVRKCDQIYYLDKGKVLAQGTYDELVCKSEKFRSMM
ncbi:MAG: ABC transporter ATP-binding protein [Oceanospirillaceae bacterium]|nr:ABC transporter ATP-binding protein [Oceanospirillaceae bacterium]